jgi:hypothetical protein
VILRTTGSGQEYSAWSHQIRLNAAGQFQCYIYDQDTGGNPNVVGTTVVQSNAWYHVAATAQNGGLMHLYVNGVEEGTPASVKTIWTGGSEFALGTGSGGGYGVEPMLLDDVAVWSSALTAQDVHNLSTGQKPSTFSGSVIIGPNLVNPQLILSGTLTSTAGENAIQPSTFTTNNGLTAVTARYLQFVADTGINGDNNTGLDEMQVFAAVDDTPPTLAMGTSVYVTYPYGPIKFVVQETPSLSSPTWAPVQSAPVLNGTNVQVFVPADQRGYFFRLAEQ